MSENMPADVQLNNGNGSISFAADVVATIAGLAATEVEGVDSMGGASGGFADILSRKQSNKSLTKGVRVEIAESAVTVHLTIVVDYGSPVPEVAGNIQENVKKAIETMSGLTVKNVDVHVQAVSFEREKSSAVAIEMQQRLLLQKQQERDEREADAACEAVLDTENAAQPPNGTDELFSEPIQPEPEFEAADEAMEAEADDEEFELELEQDDPIDWPETEANEEDSPFTPDEENE